MKSPWKSGMIRLVFQMDGFSGEGKHGQEGKREAEKGLLRDVVATV